MRLYQTLLRIWNVYLRTVITVSCGINDVSIQKKITENELIFKKAFEIA